MKMCIRDSIYMTGLVMDYLEHEVGGLENMKKINAAKAKVLYDYLDGQDFYRNPVQKEYRSMMNVTFTSPDADTDKAFCAAAAEAGFVNLKGHRLVGGMRASIYNAMPPEGIDTVSYTHLDVDKRQLHDGGFALVVRSRADKLSRSIGPDTLPYPLLCDAAGVLYEHLAIPTSKSTLMSYSLEGWRILREAKKQGYQPVKGAEQQLPLTLILDRDGTVLFCHYGASLTDCLLYTSRCV